MGSNDIGNFKLLQSFKIDYAPVTVSKWRSQKTGLTVVVGEHANPITNGYFTIASESGFELASSRRSTDTLISVFDDTGRPHTLEHLVFLGSDKYPYKGILDQFANRAGSNGTNAWTANDHTAYTIATAGSKGFLEMLPVYVDHILHPTITDAGFVTEVHHINGKGEDAGVVYSEMQGRENQSGDLMALRFQRALYPETSAYRSETGGLMHMLRQLTAQQIRDYHAKYYVPNNVSQDVYVELNHQLCLVIDGAVSLPELFEVLNEKVEPLILDQLAKRPEVSASGWKRPFVETSTSKPLSITKDLTEVVEFMEEDESMGEIYLNYLGPPPTDYRSNLALDIMGSYLTHSVTSPLQKEFIDIPKPYCSGIGLSLEDRVNHNELCLYVSDVPAKHLETFGDSLLGKLREIVKENDIDMDRMARVLERAQRKLLNSMEANVTGVLSDAIIGDFLYGDVNGKDLPESFNDLADYAVLKTWKAKDWTDLLSRYVTDAHCITMIGKPSAALAKKIEEEEKERLDKRRKDLGEEELERLEDVLEKAKAESNTPVPDGLIESFPITDAKTMTWIPCETAISNVPGQDIRADNGKLQKKVDAEGVKLPYQAHFAQVASNFVTFAVLLDTINLPSKLKPYVSIFTSAIFSVGVRRSDGTELSYEAVVDALNDLTVGHSAYLSYRGSFSEVLAVTAKVEKGDFEQAVSWIKDLLTACVFSAERLTIVVAKLLQELPAEKRSGSAIARSWINRITYDAEKATSEAGSLLASFDFLPQIAADLQDDPEKVIATLEELRTHLLQPSSMRVSVTGDVMSVEGLQRRLSDSFIDIKNPAPLSPISTCAQTLSSLGKNPSSKLVVIPMPIEGSYSYHYTKGPLGWDHPDAPAALLAAAVLSGLESYLWKSVRGSGLAYGCNVSVDREAGLTELRVCRSPNAQKAYIAAGGVIKDIVDGKLSMDQTVVDGARATLIYDYANEANTPSSAASTAYLNEVLRETGKKADQELLITLQSVTVDQVREAIAEYFLPLFNPATAIGAVSVNKGLFDEVSAGFKELGFDVERQELPTLDDDEGSEDDDEDMSEDESDDQH